mgnify:CR=1 FL=1
MHVDGESDPANAICKLRPGFQVLVCHGVTTVDASCFTGADLFAGRDEF